MILRKFKDIREFAEKCKEKGMDEMKLSYSVLSSRWKSSCNGEEGVYNYNIRIFMSAYPANDKGPEYMIDEKKGECYGDEAIKSYEESAHKTIHEWEKTLKENGIKSILSCKHEEELFFEL